MIPTRTQVKTRFLNLLDDVNGDTYTDSIFQEAFSEAFDALFNAFLNYQCPRIELIATTTLSPLTTSLTPSSLWPDFSVPQRLEERLLGSTDKYMQLTEWDILPQRDMADRLIDFVWRNDSFYFIGATTSRDLRVFYESSGEAPINDLTSINVDGSLTFLSKYAAAVAGPRKGDDVLAAQYWSDAVGPAYEQGKISGELWRIIAPRVRQRQDVQIAPRPYTVIRRSAWFVRTPFIAAQQPQGVGTAPAQFSTANGSITGTIDGVNTNFILAYPVSAAVISRNGLIMTQPGDVIFGANQIIFQSGQIPQPGDVITAQGWV